MFPCNAATVLLGNLLEMQILRASTESEILEILSSNLGFNHFPGLITTVVVFQIHRVRRGKNNSRFSDGGYLLLMEETRKGDCLGVRMGIKFRVLLGSI